MRARKKVLKTKKYAFRRSFPKRALIGLAVILVLGAIFLFSILHKVSSVSCMVENKSCPENINEVASSFVGQPMWSLNRNIRVKLQEFSEIEQFSTRISPLGDVSISVVLRDPIIAIKAEGSTEATFYTENGVPAGVGSVTSLPIIMVKEQIDSSRIPFVVELSSELTRMLSIRTYELTQSALVLTLLDSRRLLYPLDGDVDTLLGATLITFSQLNAGTEKLIINNERGQPAEEKVVQEVDFRFKNPVLRAG